MVAIRVLVVVPADDTVRRSARMAAETATRSLEAAPEALPPDVTIDMGFSAVPLGTGDATRRSLEMMAAGEGERFVVRGLMDVEAAMAYAETGPDAPQVFADAQIGGYPICPGDPALGTSSDVRGLLNVSELHRRGLNGGGAALAIVDSGINLQHLRRQGLAPRLDPHISWSPVTNIRPGHYPTDHGTMCAYCVSIAAPEVTLLDFPVLLSTRQGGSVMDGFLSDALQAYSVMLTMMALPEDRRPYHSLVVNNSWGMFHPSWDFPPGHPGRYSDNPQHPFNIIVGSLAGTGADILFAAGNCGSDCPDGRCQGLTNNVITGANSHPDVLSLAGVDTTGARVGYSSQGPGSLANDKPDVAAYTHFLGSEAFGDGSADGGTSTACPVAAGCVAAIRTQLPPSQSASANVAQAVRDNADGAGGGWNGDTGFGIINPVAVADQIIP